MFRKPFSTYQNWVSDTNMDIMHQNQATMTREEQELKHCVPFTKLNSKCFVCGEEFKTVLKDDDEWYFINCKKVKINSVSI